MLYTVSSLQVLGQAPLISPLVTVSATLYAPLSALLHGYRNTKVKRELCHMLGLTSAASEDVATPLPSRKMFRSLSMREATRVGRLRRERLGHRHSFMGPPGLTQTPGPASGDCQESHTLLLALASSSAESSARSSFSGAGGHPRYVTVLAGRQEATCWSCCHNVSGHSVKPWWIRWFIKCGFEMHILEKSRSNFNDSVDEWWHRCKTVSSSGNRLSLMGVALAGAEICPISILEASCDNCYWMLVQFGFE